MCCIIVQDDSDGSYEFEDNDYPLVKLREEIEERLNSNEHTKAMKSLRVKMEKDHSEKFRK
jgi:hypothetical protein